MIEGLELAAVCDLDPKKLDRVEDPQVKRYEHSAEMIRSGEVDAVLVATPHYDHTTIGIDALQNGLHLLVEKPLSVHKADCQRLIDAHQNPEQVFCAMFNQRTDGRYRALRQLLQSKEAGELMRVNWIVTDWYRPEIYYASGGWRATWSGEGGGVLMNQCPHNLDLIQWLFGMPSGVTASVDLGKHHDIEVEDEVSAVLEWPNGASGVFVTSTGEAPGTNRLEVTTDRLKAVLEPGEPIRLKRLEGSLREFTRKAEGPFDRPQTEDDTLEPLPETEGLSQHERILQNFADAINKGTERLAPAEEGIHSVELGNAMLLSGLKSEPVKLPISADEFEKKLHELIGGSTHQKKTVEVGEVDMGDSWK
jgi:predicted dehydrogenase